MAGELAWVCETVVVWERQRPRLLGPLVPALGKAVAFIGNPLWEPQCEVLSGVLQAVCGVARPPYET